MVLVVVVAVVVVYLSAYLQAWKRSYSARLPQLLNLTTSETKQFCETSSIFELDNIKNETICETSPFSIFELDNIKNGAILGDVFNFWIWQRQKRNKSARLPQVDSIKNEAILRDVLQKWKVECRADGLVPMRFAIFPLHLSKVLRLPRKSDARSYKVLHLSRKIILANLQIWCSKMHTLSGNQRPHLLTSLMNMCLVLRLPREMHFARSSAYVPCLPLVLKSLQNPHALLTFDKVRNPVRLPCETTLERPKAVRTCAAFYILTSKCASRHNGVHFFDITTSKSGPNVVCFVHFDLEMCFAPQRRPLFRHHNFQTRFDTEGFCTFWLPNVLRATTVCTFSTSQLPNALRHCGVLYILTSKYASHHNGVHFFDTSASKSGPNMVRFVHFDFQVCFAPKRRALFRHHNFQKWSEHGAFCTFWLPNVLLATTVCNFHLSSDLIALHPPLERAYFSTLRCHKSLEKHSVSRLSYLFAHLHLLSSDSFSFSDSSHLCFSICPYCRKFDF